MATVDYPFQFAYPFIDAAWFPVLKVQVEARAGEGRPVEVDAFLDSGAQRSLFGGWIATAIGLNLLEGAVKRYSPIAGPAIQARLHTVRLVHDDLGAFELEIGFSLEPISRNLLGRDFFDLIQVGFRERQLTLYINPVP
jgi:hypothetical protein